MIPVRKVSASKSDLTIHLQKNRAYSAKKDVNKDGNKAIQAFAQLTRNIFVIQGSATFQIISGALPCLATG
jgi:hypothetical protein